MPSDEDTSQNGNSANSFLAKEPPGPMKRGTRIQGPPRSSSIPQGAESAVYKSPPMESDMKPLPTTKLDSQRPYSPAVKTERSYSPLPNTNREPRNDSRNEKSFSPAPNMLPPRGPQSAGIQATNQMGHSRNTSNGSDVFMTPLGRMESNSSLGSKGYSRMQTLEPVETIVSPEQPTPASIKSHMSFHDPLQPKKKSSITSVLKGLESKSKPELLAIAKKMVQEISAKNRIIHETKQNEKWLMAEISLNATKQPIVPKKVGMSTLQLEMSKITATELDKDLIQTMMAFKDELTRAKSALEQHETSVMLLEKKRTVAEEEAAYLRTLIETGGKVDPAVLQNERMKELETQLQETLKDYTSLQTKVSQWARNSKRHQEGRITAEASQRVLEEEAKVAAEQLNELRKSEALLKEQLQVFQNIGSGDAQVSALQNSLIQYQSRVNTLEEKLNDTSSTLNSIQTDYSIMQSQYEDELQKRIELQNSNETLQIQTQELQEKLNAQDEFSSLSRKRNSFVPPQRNLSLDQSKETTILNHELEAVKQSYDKLQQEHRQLTFSHQETVRQLELSRQKFSAVEEAMKEQELMMNNMEDLINEKLALQKELDIANDRMKQKQLSIEMLEKHVSNAKNRLGPLQQAAENLDDLQDEFELVKNENDELKERVDQLTNQILQYERKNQRLSESLRSPISGDVLSINKAPEQIRSLQAALHEAHSTNEELTLQLEERTQDVELLESRLNAQVPLASNMFSVSNSVSQRGLSKQPITAVQQQEYNDALEELAETKKELEMNTATLAEQLISIGKMESMLAANAETIENLETEKARATQKLALMQRIKADYDAQTVQLEKLQALVAKLESQLNEPVSNSRAIGGNDQGQLETQNAALLNQLAALHNVQDENKSQANMVQSLKRTVENLQSDLQMERQNMIELQRQNQNMQSRSEDSDHSEYATRIDQLESALNSLIQQKESMTKELIELRFVKEDYEEEMMNRNGMEARMADMNKQWSRLEETIRQKEDEIDRLENELDDMQGKFQLEIKMLKEEQDNLMMERDDLLDRLEDKTTEMEELKGQSMSNGSRSIDGPPQLPPKESFFTKSQDDVSALVAKLDATEIELEELKLQLNQQAQRNSDLDPVSPEDKSVVNEHFMIAQHNQELEQKQHEIQTMASQVEDLKLELSSVSTERDQLFGELKRLEQDKLQLENDLQYQVQELDDMSRMLHEIQEGNDVQSHDFYSKEKHEQEIAAMRQKMQDLVGSIEMLQKDLEIFEKEKSEWIDKDRDANDLELSYQEALAEKQDRIDMLENEFKNAMGLVQELEQSRSLMSEVDPQIVSQLQVQLDAKEKAILNLESHIDELQNHLETARKDTEVYRNQVESLQTEVVQRSSIVNELQTKSDKSVELASKLEQLQKEVSQKDLMIQDLKKELKDLQGHSLMNEDLEVEIQQNEQRIAELEFEMSSKLEYQAQVVADLEMQLDAKERRIGDLEEQISNVKTATSTPTESVDLKELQGQIQELKEKLDQQKLQYQKASLDLKTVQAELESKLVQSEELGKELSIAKKTIQDLQSSKDTEQLLQQVKEYETRIASHEFQIQQKSNEIQNLKQTIDQMKLLLQKQSVEHQTSDRGTELTTELEQKKEEAKKLLQKAQELELANKRLQSDLEYQSSIAEDALKQVDEYEEEILSLRQQDKSAEIAAIQMQLQGNGSDPRVGELELMNDQLMDKIASLSEKLAKQDANRMSMNPAMLMQHSQSQSQINELSDQLEEAIQKLETLQSEKFMLMDQLEDLQDHNQMLQQSLHSLKK